jgi:hypothetical protein
VETGNLYKVAAELTGVTLVLSERWSCRAATVVAGEVVAAGAEAETGDDDATVMSVGLDEDEASNDDAELVGKLSWRTLAAGDVERPLGLTGRHTKILIGSIYK